MTPRPIARVLLAALLATTVALVSVAPAASASRDASVTTKKKPKPTVKLATTSIGKVLVAADGRTLYAFNPDGTNTTQSACTGGCATTWPPLTTTGKAKVGKGLDKTLLLVNDSGHVSYGGHLLYKFSGDSAAGDTNGQGVGGVWHAVTADGSTVP